MQVDSERERLARTQLTTNDRSVAAVLADMEPAISDLDCWGDVIRALGTSDEVSPLAVGVIGRAVSRAAQSLVDDWSRSITIVRGTGEAGR